MALRKQRIVLYPECQMPAPSSSSSLGKSAFADWISGFHDPADGLVIDIEFSQKPCNKSVFILQNCQKEML